MRHVSISGISIIPDVGYGLSVRDINIEISHGEVVVLYGHSGSGKSVLLGGIAGVVPLTTGDVFCGDNEVINVSYQPEMPLLPSSMTVEAYCLRMKMAVPSFFGMEQIRNRFIGELSASERRQLWITAIYSRKVDFYIYDEPALGFDFKDKEECARLLRKQAESAFVLVASNDPLFVSMAAHRMVCLERGMVTGEFSLEGEPSRECYGMRLEQIISFTGE